MSIKIEFVVRNFGIPGIILAYFAIFSANTPLFSQQSPNNQPNIPPASESTQLQSPPWSIENITFRLMALTRSDCPNPLSKQQADDLIKTLDPWKTDNFLSPKEAKTVYQMVLSVLTEAQINMNLSPARNPPPAGTTQNRRSDTRQGAAENRNRPIGANTFSAQRSLRIDRLFQILNQIHDLPAWQ